MGSAKFASTFCFRVVGPTCCSDYTLVITRRFKDPTLVGKEREGFVQGGVDPMQPDGFTKSTAVHNFGPDVNTTQTLRNLAPYVAR